MRRRLNIKYDPKAGFRALVIQTILVIALVVFMFFSCFSFYRIHGDGMAPEFVDGNIAVAFKMSYQFRLPDRGDAVIVGARVYRVIGLPDESVSIEGGSVFVNGMRLNETYLPAYNRTYPIGLNSTFQVPVDQYFLLLDSRDCYDDSRAGVFFQTDDIKEKIIFVF